MPRKRRNKKDPLAKKIDFDKEPDVPSKIVNACGPNGTSPSENDQEVFGPEADAALPTASSDPPSNAENVPTDFSHRDRWRFGRSYGVTAEEADDDDSSRGFLVVLSTFVCLFFLIMLVQWIKTEGYHFLLTWYWKLWDTEDEDGENQQDNFSTYIGLSSLSFVWSLLLSVLLGVSCLLFSWSITYQDSLQPGQFPPTPVSPKKFRKKSGHRFHSSYLMALVNGLAVFALSAWWLCT
ncbi:uncharacterized protein [Asterias amurensis]|uniref:uncharacterized protein n=1 Tax=Asterias amurensis TaxID=7602 RepID=UPI003AB32E06